MSNPHAITKEFERELCIYTGAPFAVAVNSCTMALTLAVAYQLERGTFPRGIYQGADEKTMRPWVEIPCRTYLSVPQAIIHAGGRPVFRDLAWNGWYCLNPLTVWDSARYFSSGMYDLIGVRGEKGKMMCVSFHTSKILGDSQGGAILHDNAEADAWLRRARFDGRTEGVAPKDDTFTQIGWHCYLSPDVAARLLWKLSVLPKCNEPLPNDDYPDLSLMEIFK